MNIRYLGLAALLGCGEITVRTVSDPVVVRHEVDISKLEQYFERYCRDTLPDGTPEEIQACVDLNVVNFIDALSEVSDE
jgi:hypothetical protein